VLTTKHRQDRSTYHSDEARWAAVKRRDRAAAGQFVYCVSTTGVFCRPGCGSRLPLRDNVRFHRTPAAAIKAGFRPCKRCHPDSGAVDQRASSAVLDACRRIENAPQPIALETLARSVGLSRFHLHRVFKSIVGITPKGYADAVRVRRLQHALPNSRSVTAALYDAGFNSSGRFYTHAKAALGMRPTRYQASGNGETIGYAVARSSLGLVLVAAAAKGICAISLGDDRAALISALRARFSRATLVASADALGTLLKQVIAMIESPSNATALPLDIRGTAFQQQVWRALRDIPPGETMSYAKIAQTIGMPRSIRAVGHACGANPVAVAVPCHRAVRSDGSLAGYRWGIERKRKLLELEQAPRARATLP